jgi:hypothetical protein
VRDPLSVMAGLVPAISIRVAVCSPNGAQRNAGAGFPHCAALHAGYDLHVALDDAQCECVSAF